MAVLVAVRECEVGRIVWHGVAFGGYSHLDVGQREVSRGGLSHCDGLYRIAFVLLHGFESILQLHVSVQRIILRAVFLL